MENMTIDELTIIVQELNARSKQIYDAFNDDPNWDDIPDEDKEELMSLNDEFNRYQSRLLYLSGRKIERQETKVIPTQSIDKRKADSGNYFVTISPPPEAPLKQFITAVHQFMGLNVVKEGKYVFEQRGESEEEMGKGFHCHILCERNGKPYAFKKELQRVFVKFFRNPKVFGTKVFYVENVENMEKTKVNRYICGDKFGRIKGRKVEIDKLWRRNMGLLDQYSTDSIV